MPREAETKHHVSGEKQTLRHRAASGRQQEGVGNREESRACARVRPARCPGPTVKEAPGLELMQGQSILFASLWSSREGEDRGGEERETQRDREAEPLEGETQRNEQRSVAHTGQEDRQKARMENPPDSTHGGACVSCPLGPRCIPETILKKSSFGLKGV